LAPLRARQPAKAPARGSATRRRGNYAESRAGYAEYYTGEQPVTGVSWPEAVVWLNAASEWYNAHREAGEEALEAAYRLDGAVLRSGPDAAAEPGRIEAALGADGFRLASREEHELAGRWEGAEPLSDGPVYREPWYRTPGSHAAGARADYRDVEATGAVVWYWDNAGGRRRCGDTQPRGSARGSDARGQRVGASPT